MRFIPLLLLFSLASTVASADGFRCAGEGFSVKVFHHTYPGRGARNPAALILAQERKGTLARLFDREITRLSTPDSVLYEGQGHSDVDGRFLFLQLEIYENESGDLYDSETHFGRLRLHMNRQKKELKMVCEQYHNDRL